MLFYFALFLCVSKLLLIILLAYTVSCKHSTIICKLLNLLLEIAQTLEKLGPTVIMAMSIETIMFIRHRDHDAGIQAWM